MARTRRDRRCEFDPSMCSSDTLPDNFQVGSCVLYVITDTTFFSTKVAKHTCHLSLINNPLHARVKMIRRMCYTFISMRIMPYAQTDQCIGYRVSYIVCLLVGECFCLSVATVYVRLFIVSFRTISLFLIIYSQCESFN